MPTILDCSVCGGQIVRKRITHILKRPPLCSLLCRFIAKIDFGNGDNCCWIWLGSTNKDGYGRFRAPAGPMNASHFAWLLATGSYPTAWALHHCDNPPCVRPAHLFEGNNAQNVTDRDAKGRGGCAPGEANGSAKLSEATVLEIRALADAGGITQQAIADRFGVTQVTVSAIARRAKWQHLP